MLGMRTLASSFHLTCLLALCLLLAGCSPDKPCVVCFEDEWSREPFPGQPKQHLAPLSPEDVQSKTVRPTTQEFLGAESADPAHPF